MSSALRVRPAGRVTGQVLGEAHGGAGASLPLCVAAHVAPQGSPRFTAGKTGPSRFLASPARAAVEAGTRVAWLWGGRPSSQVSAEQCHRDPLGVSACCVGPWVAAGPRPPQRWPAGCCPTPLAVAWKERAGVAGEQQRHGQSPTSRSFSPGAWSWSPHPAPPAEPVVARPVRRAQGQSVEPLKWGCGLNGPGPRLRVVLM